MPSVPEILQKTNGGLEIFQILVPYLEMDPVKKKNVRNVDSPISPGEGCFSVYFNEKKKRYLFYDHHTKEWGDIFRFVATLYKLDEKADFPSIIAMIENLQNGTSVVEDNSIETYVCDVQKSYLTLFNERTSGKYEHFFLAALPFLTEKPKYPVQLVHSFNIPERDAFFQFDVTNPMEAFYSLEIRKGQFYLLYNPWTKKLHKWGYEPEFYFYGQEHLYNGVLSENICLRKSLIATNTIDGLLFLQENHFACIGFLFGEELPNQAVAEAVMPNFENYHLLGDYTSKNREQYSSLAYSGFEPIRSRYPELGKFLIESDALDRIFNHLQFDLSFQYEGKKSAVRQIPFEDLELLEYYVA
ncbi:hypothetical protein [Flaviaesturariibacter terrae]